MSKKNNIKVSEDTAYEVWYGAKSLRDRNKRYFHNEKEAVDFFKFHQKDFHIDVFKVTTTVVREKLT